MIGYSDSAKDAGYLAAAWAQYRAQEGLTRVCHEAGVSLTLFHGRGGSISRGGSPTRVAVLSQPPGAVNGRIRVTEQGEVIRFKYGVPEVAVSNLEQYVAAVLEASIQPPAAPRQGWREEMQRLTDTSMHHYRQVVQEDPQLVPYLRTVTPEQELARFALGSRPARRNTQGGVESLRAIPWVFAWTQMRLMLPAWLGTGEALEAGLADASRKEVLHDMMANWPFFQGMVDMQEMVIAKADLTVAGYYEKRLADKPELRAFGKRLHANFRRMREQLAALTGSSDPLANNPMARWSIAVRNPYTDPLHLLQAELMWRLRREGKAKSELERALMVTIAGIAAGLRNTG
jgi:phosphoenolpyruvate carboxylase